MATSASAPTLCWFFLAINGIELDYTQEELIDIILQIASGRAKAADLLEWILYHQA